MKFSRKISRRSSNLLDFVQNLREWIGKISLMNVIPLVLRWNICNNKNRFTYEIKMKSEWLKCMRTRRKFFTSLIYNNAIYSIAFWNGFFYAWFYAKANTTNIFCHMRECARSREAEEAKKNRNRKYKHKLKFDRRVEFVFCIHLFWYASHKRGFYFVNPIKREHMYECVYIV